MWSWVILLFVSVLLMVQSSPFLSLCVCTVIRPSPASLWASGDWGTAALHPPPAACLPQEVAAPYEDDVAYQPERGHASPPSRHRHPNAGEEHTCSDKQHACSSCFDANSLPVSCFLCFLFQMVHSFSSCVLGSAEEGDLDELLATRLVSFLMDHQQSILSVPEYLLSAISDHIQYLRTVQVLVNCILEKTQTTFNNPPRYTK